MLSLESTVFSTGIQVRLNLERAPRIELGTKPWQGFVLPLNYARFNLATYWGNDPH